MKKLNPLDRLRARETQIEKDLQSALTLQEKTRHAMFCEAADYPLDSDTVRRFERACVQVGRLQEAANNIDKKIAEMLGEIA